MLNRRGAIVFMRMSTIIGALAGVKARVQVWKVGRVRYAISDLDLLVTVAVAKKWWRTIFSVIFVLIVVNILMFGLSWTLISCLENNSSELWYINTSSLVYLFESFFTIRDGNLRRRDGDIGQSFTIVLRRSNVLRWKGLQSLNPARHTTSNTTKVSRYLVTRNSIALCGN